jgi:hypothetical protein
MGAESQASRQGYARTQGKLTGEAFNPIRLVLRRMVGWVEALRNPTTLPNVGFFALTPSVLAFNPFQLTSCTNIRKPRNSQSRGTTMHP